MSSAMVPLSVFRCSHCDTVYFPRPSLCARCGTGGFIATNGSTGTVAEQTVVRHRAGQSGGASHLATILTHAGPVVIAAMDAPLENGDAVHVYEADGRLWAGAPMADGALLPGAQ
jgi:uncharacterized OB-fold protein